MRARLLALSTSDNLPAQPGPSGTTQNTSNTTDQPGAGCTELNANRKRPLSDDTIELESTKTRVVPIAKRAEDYTKAVNDWIKNDCVTPIVVKAEDMDFFSTAGLEDKEVLQGYYKTKGTQNTGLLRLFVYLIAYYAITQNLKQTSRDATRASFIYKIHPAIILAIVASHKSATLFHGITEDVSEHLKDHYKWNPSEELDKFKSSVNIVLNAYRSGTPENKKEGRRILLGFADGEALTLATSQE